MNVEIVDFVHMVNILTIVLTSLDVLTLMIVLWTVQ